MDVRTRRRLIDIVAGLAGLTIGWLLRDPVAGAFGSFLGYLIGVAIETWAVDRIRRPKSVTTSSPGKTWYEAALPETRSAAAGQSRCHSAAGQAEAERTTPSQGARTPSHSDPRRCVAGRRRGRVTDRRQPQAR